jgi:hypothetical protein
LIDGEKLDLQPKIPDTSAIEQPIRIVLETMIRGMAASCGGIPPEFLLTVIAWHVGNSLADCVIAPDGHKDRYRSLLRDAFLDGMEKAIAQPRQQPPPSRPPFPGEPQ